MIQKNKIEIFFLFFFFCSSSNCIFNYIYNNVNLPANLFGLLGETQFSFTSLDVNPMQNRLPHRIRVLINIFDKFLNITLHRVHKLRGKSPMNSKVFTEDPGNKNILKMMSHNLSYQLYTDKKNEIFATAIKNTDFKELKISDNGTHYRILLSTFLNGSQINIYPAVVINENNIQVSYKQMYFIKSTVSFDDMSDVYTNITQNDVCSSNPCKNDGSCVVAYANTFACLCANFYTGSTCENRIITTTIYCESCHVIVTNNRITNVSRNACVPNPCLNGGKCFISSTNNFTCNCSSKFIGSKCETKVIYSNQIFEKYGKGFGFAKGLANDVFLDVKQVQSKKKRSLEGIQNLFVEYLVVIDSTVYNNFLSNYANIPQTLLTDYINIFFSQVVNGINQRYQISLQNDSNLRITVNLASVLVLNDPSCTPWTNLSLVGVPQVPVFNNRYTVLCNRSFINFANFMNNISLPFEFDHAVAVMDLDIWSNTTGTNTTRSGVIGFSNIGGICSPNKYSIIEYSGFGQIQNSAHELGHNLGAVHDGTGVSLRCPAGLNNIMTPQIGYFSQNMMNLFRFSACSINSFKSTLFTPNMTNMTSAGQCLCNSPVLTPDLTYNTYLPGQLYNIDDQCRLVFGSNSGYTACYLPNDSICQTLFCVDTRSKQCTGTNGNGALDGTPCFTFGNISGYVCYQGNCIDSSLVIKTNISKTPCDPNPCQNGGQCSVYSQKTLHVCHCPNDFTGIECENQVDNYEGKNSLNVVISGPTTVSTISSTRGSTTISSFNLTTKISSNRLLAMNSTTKTTTSTSFIKSQRKSTKKN